MKLCIVRFLDFSSFLFLAIVELKHTEARSIKRQHIDYLYDITRIL